MDGSELPICCGCLSTDRKMILLEELSKKQCFLQITNDIPYLEKSRDAELWLCWECHAVVTRFTRFRSQVRKCCEILQDRSRQKPQNLPSFSHLEACIVLSYTLSPEKTETEEVLCDVIKVEDRIDIKEETMISDTLSVCSDYSDDKFLIELSEKKKSKVLNGVKKKQRRKEEKNIDILKEIEIYKEVELKRDDIEKERRQLASQEEYTNAMFRCEKCIATFPNADDLKDHEIAKHITNASSFKCKICECSFASEVSYNYHTNKHTKRYQCMICMELYGSKRGVTRHYEMTHCVGTDYEITQKSFENDPFTAESETPSFPCEYCEKSFKWKTSLRKHVETHRIATGQKRRPYCEPCRLSFTTTSNLQKHVKTSSKHQIQLKLRKLKESLPDDQAAEKHQAHIDDIKTSVNKSRETFPCGQCDKRFQWRGNLLRHLHSHAARANGELVCEPCNRTFSSIATYKQHMKISKKHVSEEDFKYMCSDCGKRFASKTRLKDHVDWEHLKHYSHTCVSCSKVFKSHTSLYLHRQVVHRQGAEHLCDHCGKPFPNYAKLRSHITARHTSQSPYACGACGARFSWHSCLSRHVRRVHRDRGRDAAARE